MKSDRVDLMFISENASDVMACVIHGSALRRHQLTVHTPLNHASVKKQMKRAVDIDPWYIVIINGDKATIRYFNTPVKLECDLVDVVPIILEYENDGEDGDDKRIVAFSDQLLSDHYFHHRGVRPHWDVQGQAA